VTPGDKAAENGMVAILGGDDAVVAAALPVLRDWAKRVVHCGPLGAGMATKIARNVVTYGSWRTVSEAAELAAAAGVDPATLAEVIETADPQGRTLLQLLHMRGTDGELPESVGRQIEPLMAKDLAAARDLATELRVDIPLADVARTHMHKTLDLTPREPAGSPRERGLAVMDAVYGDGFSHSMPEGTTPFTDATAEQLFGEVWARPGLSIRERRLLVLGATAALGRADLVRIQARGALATADLTPDQLREAVLQLAYYVGWGNATATHQGVETALAETVREKK
jgi:alkylhydroperoxidase/carboxymuconolactone decarboxylase family protein YurZ